MKNKSFNALLVGESLANAGDVFYIVALITTVFSVTDSLFYVSLVPVIKLSGGFLGGLVAPLLIDRYKLKAILLNSQLVKTCILLVLTLYVSLFLSIDTIVIIYVLIFCITFLDSFAHPASSAILPELIEEAYLLKANSLMSSVYQFINMGGWAVGGILAVLLHSNGLLIVTFILFVLSTFLLTFIKVNGEKQDAGSATEGRKMHSIFEGWKLIAEDSKLRILHIVLFLGAIAGPVWVSSIIYPFIELRLHKGNEWWGYINATFFLGLFFGGLFGYSKSDLINRNIHLVILVGSFIVFLMTFLFGINSYPLLALLVICIYGLFYELSMIAINTLIQGRVKEKLLAKVYAAQSSMMMATFGISTLIMGVLGEHFNIVVVFMVASCVSFLSFVILLTTKKSLSASSQ
ncbi:MFS transporter [Viridibacillus sp. YIM B01967]|uniref:MFS transporter n=1 Tax=Viridibacillus soli TaxID=2798301 RepID=A0ABS1HCK8_9BACL|nr:MFS transporter [Viridibacillus soli]MBK3497155.1 MFS transporter [Viridibacillus soli]